MIVTIGEKKYSFKTSFAEYTINEYMELMESFHELPMIQKISKCSNIPVDVLNTLSVADFTSICEQLRFIDNEEMLNVLSEPYNGKDVGLESYRKMEKCKALIGQSSFVRALPLIADMYSKRYIDGKPLIEVWGVVSFYNNSVTTFFEKFSRLSQHEYEDEELEAGIEALEVYKHYPIVFRIAAERSMSNDEVLELPAVEIYMQMMFEFDRSKFQTEYEKVIQQQQEHADKIAK